MFPFAVQVPKLTSRASCDPPIVKTTVSPKRIFVVAGVNVNPEVLIVQIVQNADVLIVINSSVRSDFNFII